eukprot:jgi/Tetstr1/455023/TSEL_041880.t1
MECPQNRHGAGLQNRAAAEMLLAPSAKPQAAELPLVAAARTLLARALGGAALVMVLQEALVWAMRCVWTE